MEYNIVTSYSINQILRNNSKYYKVNLGQSLTLEDRSGERVLNHKDQFAFVYNNFYKAQIMRQGTIGDITFYTDHEIREDVVALYIDREEFTHPFDASLIRERGVDSYLGSILKKSKEEYEQMQNKDSEDATNSNMGEADRLVHNPGAVTYADLKAFIEKKNSERLKTD